MLSFSASKLIFVLMSYPPEVISSKVQPPTPDIDHAPSVYSKLKHNKLESSKKTKISNNPNLYPSEPM